MAASIKDELRWDRVYRIYRSLDGGDRALYNRVRTNYHNIAGGVGDDYHPDVILEEALRMENVMLDEPPCNAAAYEYYEAIAAQDLMKELEE